MFRLSKHGFAIERGQHRKIWLSREDRLCVQFLHNQVETELHFLTSCQMYEHIRDTYFTQITQTHKEFENISNLNKLAYIFGEMPVCHHSSKMCDLSLQEKINRQSTNTIVNTTYIYFPFCTSTICTLLQHCTCTVMTFETSIFFKKKL